MQQFCIHQAEPYQKEIETIFYNKNIDLIFSSNYGSYQRFNNRFFQTKHNVLSEYWDSEFYKPENYILGHQSLLNVEYQEIESEEVTINNNGNGYILLHKEQVAPGLLTTYYVEFDGEKFAAKDKKIVNVIAKDKNRVYYAEESQI